ncbi:hypothetical protein B4064_2401 [Caldibacillus thermoamylovorans]|nr:hypothetical protein B4065_2981 [Caldibacillus thermoamylovorans]KIO65908.1 hypothetical protein B4064_2401 [Caldibacillus thermoamylovorans]
MQSIDFDYLFILIIVPFILHEKARMSESLLESKIRIY